MRHLLALVLPVALFTACDRGTSIPGSPSDTGIALARSGRAKDSLILVKDSILAERQRAKAELPARAQELAPCDFL